MGHLRAPERLSADRLGHTSPGAACPDCAPVWSGLIGGSFRPPRLAAAASSGSPSKQLRPATPKRSEPPAGGQPATASGSRQAGAGYSGRAALWIRATGAPSWLGAVVTAGARPTRPACEPRAKKHRRSVVSKVFVNTSSRLGKPPVIQFVLVPGEAYF